jgi:hypothetical protein
MFGRQRLGPCWPRYIFTFGPAGGGACAPSSPIATSAPSAGVGACSSLKPYVVGMIALGVSSPAYPARRDDAPMSTTRADISST